MFWFCWNITTVLCFWQICVLCASWQQLRCTLHMWKSVFFFNDCNHVQGDNKARIYCCAHSKNFWMMWMSRSPPCCVVVDRLELTMFMKFTFPFFPWASLAHPQEYSISSPASSGCLVKWSTMLPSDSAMCCREVSWFWKSRQAAITSLYVPFLFLTHHHLHYSWFLQC